MNCLRYNGKGKTIEVLPFQNTYRQGLYYKNYSALFKNASGFRN